MLKEQRAVVMEYVASLSEQDLSWLGTMLSERLQNDLGDALNYLGKEPQIDTIFQGAETAWALYDLCDKTTDIVIKELKYRSK